MAKYLVIIDRITCRHSAASSLCSTPTNQNQEKESERMQQEERTVRKGIKERQRETNERMKYLSVHVEIHTYDFMSAVTIAPNARIMRTQAYHIWATFLYLRLKRGRKIDVTM